MTLLQSTNESAGRQHVEYLDILKSEFFSAQDGAVSLNTAVRPEMAAIFLEYYGIDQPPPNLLDGSDGVIPEDFDRAEFAPFIDMIRAYTALHKHKSLHKHKHKHKHKGLLLAGGQGRGKAAPTDLDWPAILHPIDEQKLLHKLRPVWSKLDPGLPQAKEIRVSQIDDLVTKQCELLGDDQAIRRQDIIDQAGNSLKAYFQPLGGNVGLEGTETAVLFQKIVWICGEIGLYFKSNYAAQRPSQLSNELQPYIPVPSHSSYPSNHSFQSYAIAQIFARAVPEHPGAQRLFEAAQKVAENREYAGLHVVDDTEAGERLARLCLPVLEEVLEVQMLRARADWV